MDGMAKLQYRAPSPPRFFNFFRIPFSTRNRKQPHYNFWIFFSAIVAFALFLHIFFASKTINSPRFSIVIDAGSTGTRLHVFGYSVAPGTMLPMLDLTSTSEMKVNPGLSSYSRDPEGAGSSLVELLEFAKRKVPVNRWGITEIRLMATAGLRMLDSEVRDRILNSCRRFLKSSGFRFRDNGASVISGSDEGIFAWVAANYALGTLGGDPQNTTGIIELGGASAQITFVSSEALPAEFSHVVYFQGSTYNLYSNSFLHFGQNVAHESVKELIRSRGLILPLEDSPSSVAFVDPCSPVGISHTGTSPALSASISGSSLENHAVAYKSGNFSKCRSAAVFLLQKEKDKCMYQQCDLGSNYIPKLQGRFLATENFFFTSKFFELGPTAVISDFELAGQKFCEEDWQKLKRKYHNLDEEDFPRYCFSSAYIVALLHDSLGIAMDDKKLWFADRVGSIPLDWALGAFIMKNNEQPDWITAIFHGSFFTLLGFILLFLLLILAVWLVLILQKPRLKTIFDLEKGRYIVTKVNR